MGLTMRETRDNSGAFWAAFLGAAIGSGALAKIHLAPILMVAIAIATLLAIFYCVRAAFSWLPEGIRGPAHAGFWLGLLGGVIAGCGGAYHGLDTGDAMLRMVGCGLAAAAVFGVFGAVSSRSPRHDRG
jgi:hypothetical protein